jgi:ubiquinone biosynthesis monooxygenase Coq6
VPTSTGTRSTSSVRCLTTTTTTTTTTRDDDGNYLDVLIVGGGGVGCSLARLLNERAPSLKVGLMEARDAPPTTQQPPSERVPHPRSYALSPNSLKILGESVTSQLPLGYYDSMQVWQAKSPASLTFTSRDLDADPTKAPYLGACVEDGPMVSALWKEISDDNNSNNNNNNGNNNNNNKTKCWTNTTLESITTGDAFSLATATTKEGQTVRAGLLVGADGGNSFVRKAIGVSRIGTEYEQHALTFTVALQGEMRQRAFQRFLADGGPMALLPTYSPNHGVIVWSTSPETIQEWKGASNEDLVNHLNDCLMEGPQRIPSLLERQDSSSSSDVWSNILYEAERLLDTMHYGMAMAAHHPSPKYATPPRIDQVVSPKFSFPLSCFQARSYTKGRVALIGDAAHTVHPMAGQGLNLGLADVQVLAECIEKAHASGMDVSTFLEEYAVNRQRNVSLSLGGIHALQRLFDNPQSVPLQHAKTLGMNVIQNLGPLRRQLAAAAAHGVSI